MTYEFTKGNETFKLSMLIGYFTINRSRDLGKMSVKWIFTSIRNKYLDEISYFCQGCVCLHLKEQPIDQLIKRIGHYHACLLHCPEEHPLLLRYNQNKNLANMATETGTSYYQVRIVTLST